MESVIPIQVWDTYRYVKWKPVLSRYQNKSSKGRDNNSDEPQIASFMRYISLKTIELLSFKMFHYSGLTNPLACTIISAVGNLSPSTSQFSLIFLYKTYSAHIAPYFMATVFLVYLYISSSVQHDALFHGRYSNKHLWNKRIKQQPTVSIFLLSSFVIPSLRVLCSQKRVRKKMED